ncbi:MAG: hypothetical protein HOK21_06595 [Rhodospirillaceae bacterium]|nr:hypothetical protein [Rhodospirillaceae bacterium]MBT4691610.1 hypothetical protein [Rhodospirillaceae bacterium]MBT5081262.1 hypothetical protein [Rhodospirillaceae bacterium]MBT5523734.1 hypothetical protein [Rhodospirillaceae bacterium]MBT5878325.1 hypothetical protein [Rhodospirillaceae bacterium]
MPRQTGPLFHLSILVDDLDRPLSRHFGVILPSDDWQAMEIRLKDSKTGFTLSTSPVIRGQSSGRTQHGAARWLRLN